MKGMAGRTVMTLALVASLAFVIPATAGANSPHPILTLQQYRSALHTYQLAKDAIDATLHRQIITAKDTEVAAIRAAKSPGQVYLARVDFNVARATDITAWQAALAKLGPPPRNPFAPPLSTSTSSTTSTTLTSLPPVGAQVRQS